MPHARRTAIAPSTSRPHFQSVWTCTRNNFGALNLREVKMQKTRVAYAARPCLRLRSQRRPGRARSANQQGLAQMLTRGGVAEATRLVARRPWHSMRTQRRRSGCETFPASVTMVQLPRNLLTAIRCQIFHHDCLRPGRRWYRCIPDSAVNSGSVPLWLRRRCGDALGCRCIGCY